MVYPEGKPHDPGAADLTGWTGLLYTTSFGTDSSLTVTKGWDNVTGFGEPNGLPFIQAVTGKTKGAPTKP